MINGNRSIVECITATLRDEILSGQYRAGERLPSERDLASRFQANRGAIRESLKKLEQLGIASINPGGVRIIPLEEASLSIVGPLLDLQEFPEVRPLPRDHGGVAAVRTFVGFRIPETVDQI